MGIGTSTYYGLTKVRDQAPSAKDWATTDFNFELISRLVKAFEQHHHTGVTAMNYPGFQIGSPTTPIPPTITEFSTGGILTPGTAVGVRLGFQNSLGLETQGSPEVTYTTLGATSPPLTPVFVSSVGTVSGGLSGGNYIYAMTKKKGSGETTISNVLPVAVAYDQNYNVTISFAAINTYTDGTDSYNIYRSAGLDAAFQLVTTITNTATTSFTDTNTIAPGNQNVQPPVSNTFDASKKVRISWSAITIPPTATRLRVYVTQQSGIWSTNHLLQDFDLSASPPNFVDYLGSESLQTGWPAEASEIPDQPPKLDLGAEATGAPTLTADMDFAGFKGKNMSINFLPSVTLADGLIWYDASTSKFRGRAGGSTVDLTSGALPQTNYVANSKAGDVAVAGHPGGWFFNLN